MGAALCKLCKDDFDDEAICCARAAKRLVQKDMFQLQATFTGSFDEACQVNLVPQSLLTIIVMILDGPNIQSQSQSSSRTHQAPISVAQLLQYNSTFWRRAEIAGSARHNKTRQTPLPIYVGLTVHVRTRKRDLVETLFDLALSISYDRVLAIATTMGNRVCEQYTKTNIRQGIFTTAALDKITHNPSSMTATDYFLSMALESHCSSTPHPIIMGLTAGNIVSLMTQHRQRHWLKIFWHCCEVTIQLKLLRCSGLLCSKTIYAIYILPF